LCLARHRPLSVAACLSSAARRILSRMGTKSRETVYGGSVRAAAERTTEARKEADRLACEAWNKRMLGFQGPAQPSPALGDAINAGWLSQTLAVRSRLCVLALAILTISAVSVTSSARAQTYDPAFPVCLHVWRHNYYDCSYTSLPQCNGSASGRPAQCVINPYYAGATGPQRRDRRYRGVY
jgi:hypothetical protein